MGVRSVKSRADGAFQFLDSSLRKGGPAPELRLDELVAAGRSITVQGCTEKHVTQESAFQSCSKVSGASPEALLSPFPSACKNANTAELRSELVTWQIHQFRTGAHPGGI